MLHYVMLYYLLCHSYQYPVLLPPFNWGYLTYSYLSYSYFSFLGINHQLVSLVMCWKICNGPVAFQLDWIKSVSELCVYQAIYPNLRIYK